MAISNSANNNTITVKQGRQILQLETSSELIAGQKWYILNQKWWLEFVDKVEKSKDENEVVKMPPISNEDIVVAGKQLTLKINNCSGFKMIRIMHSNPIFSYKFISQFFRNKFSTNSRRHMDWRLRSVT